MNRQRWLAPAMFLPAIIYIVALVGLPFVLAFMYSVGDVKVGSVGYHFVGLKNFNSILHNPTFLHALRNSFLFTISSQVLVLIGANILALALAGVCALTFSLNAHGAAEEQGRPGISHGVNLARRESVRSAR